MMARALPVPPLGRQTVLSRLDLPSHPHGSLLRASEKRDTVLSSLIGFMPWLRSSTSNRARSAVRRASHAARSVW